MAAGGYRLLRSPSPMPAATRLDANGTPTAGPILNGTKMWITNGGIADLAIVWARPTRGCGHPHRHAGFTTHDIHQKPSLRASVTRAILDDGAPRRGRPPRRRRDARLPSCLSEARSGSLEQWGGPGLLQAALDHAGHG
jgi:glutaryl-CoA dehydrogenase